MKISTVFTKKVFSRLKEKRTIISISSFFVFFLFFFYNNHYYLPSVIDMQVYVDNTTNIIFKWDTGNGFNDQEKAEFLLKTERKGKHRVEIQRLSGEVWILKISTDEEEHINLNENLQIDKTALRRGPDDKYVVLNTEGSSVVYEGDFSKIEILLMTHPFSGDARIILDGAYTETVNLTTEKNSVKLVKLDSSLCPSDKFDGYEKFSRTVKLPQVSIKGIMLESTSQEREFIINKLIIKSSNGEIELPFKKEELSSKVVLTDLNMNTQRFNPVLFYTQILLALLLAWIVYEFLGLKKHCQKENWGATFRFIFFEEKHWIFWTMFLTSFIIFFLWLLGQWPGMMTNDSFDSWQQIKTLKFSNFHPYVFTLYILVLTQILNSPAMVGLFQILIVSALGSYIFYFLIKEGLNFILVIPFFIAFIFSPLVGAYNIVIWKDIPFSILIVFWAFYMYYLCYRKVYSSYEQFSFKKVLLLSFLLILLCLIRHNGIVYLIFLPLIIGLLRVMPRKRYILFLVFTFIFYIFFQYRVANFLEIYTNKNYRFLHLGWKLNPIAALFARGYTSDDYAGDREIIEKLVSVEDIKANYSPSNANYVGARCNTGISDEALEKVNMLFYKRIPPNLPVFIADRSHMFFSTLSEGWIYGNNLGSGNNVYVNASTIIYSPKLPELGVIQNKILSETMVYKGMSGGRFIFANATFGFFILVIVFLLNRWLPASALSASVILYQLFFIFIVLPANDFRYVYFVSLFSFFVLPLVFLEVKARIMKNKNLRIF